MRPLVALLTLPLVLCVAPHGAAAAAGVLYATNTIVTPAAVPPGGACDPVHYGFSSAIPAATGKAYLNTGLGAADCRNYFDYVAGAALTLTGSVVVDLYLGCDVAAAGPPGAGGVPSWQWTLMDGSTTVATGSGSDQITCSGGTTYTHLTSAGAATHGSVAAGDTLVLVLDVFEVNPSSPVAPSQDMYIVTGAASSPSAIKASGFPVGEPIGAEAIDLLAPAPDASGMPGGTASYNLTVRSAGVATNFTLNATGLPAGYQATFMPARGALAHNASVTTMLMVAVPASAAPGNVSFTAKVLGQHGANKSASLVLHVTAMAPTNSPPSTTPSGAATSSGTHTAPPSSSSTTSAAKSPGLATVTLAAAFVALAAWRRR
ncbi:MAG: COG1470 family protein [Thermoplasmatota archaeon]